MGKLNTQLELANREFLHPTRAGGVSPTCLSSIETLATALKEARESKSEEEAEINRVQSEFIKLATKIINGTDRPSTINHIINSLERAGVIEAYINQPDVQVRKAYVLFTKCKNPALAKKLFKLPKRPELSEEENANLQRILLEAKALTAEEKKATEVELVIHDLTKATKDCKEAKTPHPSLLSSISIQLTKAINLEVKEESKATLEHVTTEAKAIFVNKSAEWVNHFHGIAESRRATLSTTPYGRSSIERDIEEANKQVALILATTINTFLKIKDQIAINQFVAQVPPTTIYQYYLTSTNPAERQALAEALLRHPNINTLTDTDTIQKDLVKFLATANYEGLLNIVLTAKPTGDNPRHRKSLAKIILTIPTLVEQLNASTRLDDLIRLTGAKAAIDICNRHTDLPTKIILATRMLEQTFSRAPIYGCDINQIPILLNIIGKEKALAILTRSHYHKNLVIPILNQFELSETEYSQLAISVKESELLEIINKISDKTKGHAFFKAALQNGIFLKLPMKLQVHWMNILNLSPNDLADLFTTKIKLPEGSPEEKTQSAEVIFSNFFSNPLTRDLTKKLLDADPSKTVVKNFVLTKLKDPEWANSVFRNGDQLARWFSTSEEKQLVEIILSPNQAHLLSEALRHPDLFNPESKRYESKEEARVNLQNLINKASVENIKQIITDLWIKRDRPPQNLNKLNAVIKAALHRDPQLSHEVVMDIVIDPTYQKHLIEQSTRDPDFAKFKSITTARIVAMVNNAKVLAELEEKEKMEGEEPTAILAAQQAAMEAIQTRLVRINRELTEEQLDAELEIIFDDKSIFPEDNKKLKAETQKIVRLFRLAEFLKNDLDIQARSIAEKKTSPPPHELKQTLTDILAKIEEVKICGEKINKLIGDSKFLEDLKTIPDSLMNGIFLAIDYHYNPESKSADIPSTRVNIALAITAIYQLNPSEATVNELIERLKTRISSAHRETTTSYSIAELYNIYLNNMEDNDDIRIKFLNGLNNNLITEHGIKSAYEFCLAQSNDRIKYHLAKHILSSDQALQLTEDQLKELILILNPNAALTVIAENNAFSPELKERLKDFTKLNYNESINKGFESTVQLFNNESKRTPHSLTINKEVIAYLRTLSEELHIGKTPEEGIKDEALIAIHNAAFNDKVKNINLGNIAKALKMISDSLSDRYINQSRSERESDRDQTFDLGPGVGFAVRARYKKQDLTLEDKNKLIETLQYITSALVKASPEKASVEAKQIIIDAGVENSYAIFHSHMDPTAKLLFANHLLHDYIDEILDYPYKVNAIDGQRRINNLVDFYASSHPDEIYTIFREKDERARHSLAQAVLKSPHMRQWILHDDHITQFKAFIDIIGPELLGDSEDNAKKASSMFSDWTKKDFDKAFTRNHQTNKLLWSMLTQASIVQSLTREQLEEYVAKLDISDLSIHQINLLDKNAKIALLKQLGNETSENLTLREKALALKAKLTPEKILALGNGLKLTDTLDEDRSESVLSVLLIQDPQNVINYLKHHNKKRMACILLRELDTGLLKDYKSKVSLAQQEALVILGIYHADHTYQLDDPELKLSTNNIVKDIIVNNWSGIGESVRDGFFVTDSSSQAFSFVLNNPSILAALKEKDDASDSKLKRALENAAAGGYNLSGGAGKSNPLSPKEYLEAIQSLEKQAISGNQEAKTAAERLLLHSFHFINSYRPPRTPLKDEDIPVIMELIEKNMKAFNLTPEAVFKKIKTEVLVPRSARVDLDINLEYENQYKILGALAMKYPDLLKETFKRSEAYKPPTLWGAAWRLLKYAAATGAVTTIGAMGLRYLGANGYIPSWIPSAGTTLFGTAAAALGKTLGIGLLASVGILTAGIGIAVGAGLYIFREPIKRFLKASWEYTKKSVFNIKKRTVGLNDNERDHLLIQSAVNGLETNELRAKLLTNKELEKQFALTILRLREEGLPITFTNKENEKLCNAIVRKYEHDYRRNNSGRSGKIIYGIMHGIGWLFGWPNKRGYQADYNAQVEQIPPAAVTVTSFREELASSASTVATLLASGKIPVPEKEKKLDDVQEEKKEAGVVLKESLTRSGTPAVTRSDHLTSPSSFIGKSTSKNQGRWEERKDGSTPKIIRRTSDGKH